MAFASASASALQKFASAKDLVKAAKCVPMPLPFVIADSYAEALTLLETVMTTSSDPSTHFYLALCLTQQRLFERALPAWDEAIKRQPGSLAGSFNKGLTLCFIDHWLAAQTQLERASLLDPADLDCQILLGGCRLFGGDYERAWENFDFVIEVDASKEEAYVFRGYSKLLQGKPAEAVQDLSRARNALSFKLLGDGLLSVKDPKRAMFFYQSAQKLQPDLPELTSMMKVAKDMPSSSPQTPLKDSGSNVANTSLKDSGTDVQVDLFLLGSPLRSRRVTATESPLTKLVLADATARLLKLQRLKQEAQQLVVWQWRKVMFGEEEMLAKVPYDIVRLGTTLRRDHIEDEGIFRLAASGTVVQYAFRKIQFGESETVDLRPSYLCANLLGRYAKSLRTKFTANALREWAAVVNEPVAKQITHLQRLLSSLSPFHRVILQYYVDIFAAVADKADKNRMTPRNLAAVMAPNFIEEALSTDVSMINSGVTLLVACITNRIALFTEPIAGHLSSADDAWENFSQEMSDNIEMAFQQGQQSYGMKINGDDYEVTFKLLLQMKVSDRNRQRPVRRRVLHHDQTTFNLLQVVDESPDRPDGPTTLRTVFDVLSLLPKTVKCPHFGSPTFPGTDCLVSPWPVPLGYQLEAFLGPTFLQSALSYILQNFLCGPPAYHCWLQPTFLPQCRYVLFVRYGGGESVTWSALEGLKAAFHLIRLHNVQNRTAKDQEIKTVTLKPFESHMTVAHFKQMALAYSELFTSSSTTRQVLCGVRSLESF